MGIDYVIADLHFGDKNIIYFENRPFKDIVEMHETMIQRWNYQVTEDDHVFVLGDFFDNSMTDNEIVKILKELRGRITLIRGNHDTDNVIRVLRENNVEVIDYPIIYDDFFILSHYPMYVSNQMPYANVFGHIHNNPMYKTVSTRSYCVSAERVNYTPITMSIVKELILLENKK